MENRHRKFGVVIFDGDERPGRVGRDGEEGAEGA